MPSYVAGLLHGFQQCCGLAVEEGLAVGALCRGHAYPHGDSCMCVGAMGCNLEPKNKCYLGAWNECVNSI